MVASLRDEEYQHDEEVLFCLLDQPHGRKENDDDVGAQDHGEQLGLQRGESEALNNDVIE